MPMHAHLAEGRGIGFAGEELGFIDDFPSGAFQPDVAAQHAAVEFDLRDGCVAEGEEWFGMRLSPEKCAVTFREIALAGEVRAVVSLPRSEMVAQFFVRVVGSGSRIDDDGRIIFPEGKMERVEVAV